MSQPPETYPNLSGELSIEIQNDQTYHAEDDDRELNDLFTKTEPAFSLAFTQSFSIEAALTLEPVEDPEPGESREFDREGLFVEQLFAKLSPIEDLEIYAGKFNVHFARGYDDALGLYGIDFPEDYEITERIGLGAAYDLGSEAIGSHVVTLESFFADTTNLSRSLLRSRGRLRRSDGGPSNTGRLNSYALALDGSEIPLVPGLSYTLGFVYMADGEDGVLERDYVVGSSYERPLTDHVGLKLFGEAVYQDQADGEPGRLRRYQTGSIALTYDAIELAYSYTRRAENIRDAEDNRDFLQGISLGYSVKLGPGDAKFEVGYKRTHEQNQRVGVAGGRFAYVVGF